MTGSEIRERILGQLLAQESMADASTFWLNSISPDSPTPPLVERLLNTGRELARESVRYQLSRYITGFNRAHLTAPHDYLSPTDDRTQRLAAQLMAAWTAGNFRTELPGIPEVIKPKHVTASLDQFYSLIQQHHDTTEWNTNEYYWRGLAVLVGVDIAVPMVSKDEVDTVLRFLKLPGGHADLQLEINLINDRKSYDADLISGLLQASSEVEPAIRSGIL